PWPNGQVPCRLTTWSPTRGATAWIRDGFRDGGSTANLRRDVSIGELSGGPSGELRGGRAGDRRHLSGSEHREAVRVLVGDYPTIGGYSLRRRGLLRSDSSVAE